MNEDDGLPAIQHLHQGVESLVAQVLPPAVGRQFHPIGPQCIEGIDGLGHGRLHIGQREGGTKAEAIGMGCFQSGTIFVTGPYHLPALLVVAETGLRSRHRQHRAGNAGTVHKRQVRIDILGREREPLFQLGMMPGKHLPIIGQNVVAMHIDYLSGKAGEIANHKENHKIQPPFHRPMLDSLHTVFRLRYRAL